MTISASSADNALLGRTVHVELSDLAPSAGRAEAGEAFAKGPWVFDIQLPSESENITYAVGKELENSVYVVESIEVTQISLKIDYSLNGEPEIWREDNNIPMVRSITLKDGTVLDNSDELARPMIDSGRRSFYEAEDGTAKAYGLIGLSRVIDPDEIAEVELVEFSEATVWGDIPDEIVAKEYGGKIPFERIYPGEEQHWFINLLK